MSDIHCRAWFDGFVDVFNSNDCDGVARYLASDLELHAQTVRFSSSRDVMDFLRLFMSRVTNTLEVLSFVSRPGRIAVEVRTTLEAHEDWLDFPALPLVRGQKHSSTLFIFCDIINWRFARIRPAQFRELP